MSYLEDNLRRVQDRIRVAAERARRDPDRITLVAVTKTISAETVGIANTLGVTNFGENRVEEAAGKIPAVNNQRAAPITWHMIGHIQHRKVRDVAALFDCVQSVDSVPLAQRLDERTAGLGKRLPILLEINVAGESSKYGFAHKPLMKFEDAVAEILTFKHLDIRGLMTVAPMVSEQNQARVYFAAMRELRGYLKVQFPNSTWEHLSMGMTDDFEAAIAEGATIVRIGRAIFGSRS